MHKKVDMAGRVPGSFPWARGTSSCRFNKNEQGYRGLIAVIGVRMELQGLCTVGLLELLRRGRGIKVQEVSGDGDDDFALHTAGFDFSVCIGHLVQGEDTVDQRFHNAPFG